MARIQVYLPDDLYKQVKERGLPVSEILQKAVRAELRRLDLLAETEHYVDSLVAEVGAPTADEMRDASAVAQRLARRAALLRSRARRGSAVDALVIAFAEPGGTVLTSDAGDLGALAEHATGVVVERV